MRTLKGTVSLGYAGADVEFEFEVPDDATEEEINAVCWECAIEYIDCYWEDKVERSLNYGQTN